MVQLIFNFKQASEKRQYFPSQKFLNQVKFIIINIFPCQLIILSFEAIIIHVK